MKKLFYLVVCCATVAAFPACKSKTKTAAQTPALAAKEYHECIRDSDYEAFVDAIVFEEPSTAMALTPAQKKSANTANAKTIKTIHHETVQEKGGIKDVTIVSENIAPDGKSADVILAGTYNNGEIETITYKMVYDDTKWKIRVNENKEVWKAVTKDGDREVIKLRDGDRRDFIKVKDDGEKMFVKEIDGSNRDVVKTLEDGNKEVFVDRDTKQGEVVRVKEDGKQVEVVKTKSTDKRTVNKEKVAGEKEFIKVIERKNGQIEVIKTLENGERHKEIINNPYEDQYEMERAKEIGERAIEEAQDDKMIEAVKAVDDIDTEIIKVKEKVTR